MPRDGDRDRYNGNIGPDMINLRMLIDSSEVGPVIGVGGETVKSIREESSCRVNIRKAENPGDRVRIAHLCGTSEQISNAVKLIADQISKLSNASKKRVSFSLTIYDRFCGAIIGKKGETLKKLREQSSCSINVHSEFLPGSTDRAIDISGSSPEIGEAIQEICDILVTYKERNPDVGDGTPYVPMSMPREPIPPQQPRFYDPRPAPRESFSPRNDMMYRRRMGPTPGGGGFRDGLEKSMNVEIPQEVIGAVIGARGVNINHVRNDSGARVNIPEGKSSEGMRTCELVGNVRSVEKALFRISNLVQEFEIDKGVTLPVSQDDENSCGTASLLEMSTRPSWLHQSIRIVSSSVTKDDGEDGASQPTRKRYRRDSGNDE